MKKNIVFALLLVVIMLLILGCETEDPAEDVAPEETDEEMLDYISIGTGGTGGVWYPAGVALSEMLENKAFPETHTAAQESAGTYDNLNALIEERIEIAMSQPSASEQAYYGDEPFDEEHNNLRFLTGFQESAIQIVVKPDIENIDDLRGKNVAIGEPGSGCYFHFCSILYGLGIDPEEDINADPIQYAEAAEAFRDGRVVANLHYGEGNATIIELFSATDADILSFTEEDVQKTNEYDSSFYLGTIPAETYPGQDDAIDTIFYIEELIVRDDMPDEVAYQIVKTIFENLEDLGAQASAWDNITLEVATKSRTIPIHPGAERYFQEVGILD